MNTGNAPTLMIGTRLTDFQGRMYEIRGMELTTFGEEGEETYSLLINIIPVEEES